MTRRNRLRSRLGTCAVFVTLCLSPVSALASTAARSTPALEKYRFQLAGAPPPPPLTLDVDISLRQVRLAGIAGIKTAPAAATIHDESRAKILPWTGLGSNALRMFSGSSAILHLSAAAGTFLIVQSGSDKNVHNYFARHTSIGDLSWPGVVLGSVFPVVLGGSLLGRGLTGGSSELASAGSAVLQASLLAVSYSTVLKALTGRAHPEPVIYEDNEAGSSFRFGFLRGGAFWGWPSGHLLANTAAVTSLFTFYKDKTWLKVSGGTYLGYLFLSVISHHGSSMHWFSDEVAGTLMGFAIGTTVGRDFRRRWEGPKNGGAGLSFSATPQLFSVSFSFAL
jgi:hypothetical protein